MIDIVTEHLDDIPALCRQFGVRRLDLFGSAAAGAFDPATSDLDFVATFADTRRPRTTPSRYLDFAEALEALLGRPVDVVIDARSATPASARLSTPPASPSMTNETRQRLLDALESCHTIRRYTAGIDFAAYLRDGEKQDAVERRLGIIGEALHRAATMEPTLAEQLPELRQIVGPAQPRHPRVRRRERRDRLERGSEHASITRNPPRGPARSRTATLTPKAPLPAHRAGYPLGGGWGEGRRGLGMRRIPYIATNDSCVR